MFQVSHLVLLLWLDNMILFWIILIYIIYKIIQGIAYIISWRQWVHRQ